MLEIPVPGAERPEDDRIYGLVLNRAGDDVLEEILKLYDESLSGHAQERMDAVTFREALKEHRFSFEFGSWSSPRTQLFAVSYFRDGNQVLRFFATTPGIPDTVSHIKLVRELRQNESQFGHAVSDFLRNTDVGHELPRAHHPIV